MLPGSDNEAVFVAAGENGSIIFGIHTIRNASFICPGRPIDTPNIFNFELCDPGTYRLTLILYEFRAIAAGTIAVVTTPAGNAFPIGNVNYPGPDVVMGQSFFSFTIVVETTLSFVIISSTNIILRRTPGGEIRISKIQ